ncbi:MAG: hypothetical protein KAG34_10970, partial [Cocleimonas sp.]|nr:hypothetical protein [Cocleimonas sp.]
MFTTRTINEVISRFHKGSHFILPLLSITIMISFTTHSYAENKDDKDSNVRKAVINQLLILSGKSKHKEEEPKDAGQDKEVRKRSVKDTIAEQPVNISSNKRIAKSKKEEKKTIKATAVQPLVTFKDKLTNNPNKEKQKSPQPIPNKTPTTSVKIQTVKNKETTPLVEVLSNKEIQTLMLDVMHSSNQEIKPQETSSAQVQVSSPPKVTSREKATDNSDKPEQKNN